MPETRCPYPDCSAQFSVEERLLGRGVDCIVCGRGMTARPQALWGRLERRERYVLEGRGDAASPASEEAIEGQRRYLYHGAPQADPYGGELSRDPMYEASIDRDEPRGPPVGLVGVLDDIRSRWNVGAIFRTAEAAGWQGLALCGITAVPPAAMIRKTALGAEQILPWTYHASVLAGLRGMADDGVELLALELTDDAQDVFDVSLPARAAVVVGNEVAGVSREAMSLCTRRLAIPMLGRKGSLNVAVAFGVAAFALARRWQMQHG